MSHPGLRARQLLVEHMEAGCADCERYLSAVTGGMHPSEAIRMRCERAQELQMQSDALAAGEPDEGARYPDWQVP